MISAATLASLAWTKDGELSPQDRQDLLERLFTHAPPDQQRHGRPRMRHTPGQVGPTPTGQHRCL